MSASVFLRAPIIAPVQRSARALIKRRPTYATASTRRRRKDRTGFFDYSLSRLIVTLTIIRLIYRTRHRRCPSNSICTRDFIRLAVFFFQTYYNVNLYAEQKAPLFLYTIISYLNNLYRWGGEQVRKNDAFYVTGNL